MISGLYKNCVFFIFNELKATCYTQKKNLSCVENCKILALKRGQHVYPLKTTFNFAYPITTKNGYQYWTLDFGFLQRTLLCKYTCQLQLQSQFFFLKSLFRLQPLPAGSSVMVACCCCILDLFCLISCCDFFESCWSLAANRS